MINKIDLNLLSTVGASDGQALVYNAASGTVNFGTAGGGGVSVYANTSLLPNTGVSVGSQAYVEDVDRLYLYTSLNAWYQITTTNSPPNAISNYLSAYYLASNGAPTVIFFVSSDPELVPLSWSYAVSNGVLGNTTVTHSANVFTVTPSTSTSDEGNFTLTVTATDGAYSVNANVLFYLSFVEGWNVANATLVGAANLAYRTAQEGAPYGVQFTPNGNSMYVIGTSGDDITEYALASPWNLDTVTFVTQYPLTANTTANNMLNPTCFQLSSEGANLYVAGRTTTGATVSQIVQFSLPTPNSFTTINLSGNVLAPYSVTTQETVPTEAYIRDDGTRMYVLGSSADRVQEYALSNPWDPSSATFTSFFAVGAKDSAPQGLYFTSSGNAFFIVGTSSDAVHRYDMSTPWSVNSAVFTSSFPVANQEITPNSVEFKPEGDRMYVMGASGDDVNEYSLSTPWDITTASFVQLKSVSAQATDPNGFRFSSDGTKAYMNGTAYRVHYYTLSEAWNVATMTFQYSWDPFYEDGTLNGISFSPAGDYLYLVTDTNDRVTPFALRTPWDLTSAYLPGRLVKPSWATVNHFRINPEGTKVFVTNSTINAIEEYTLSIPGDISSASLSNSFSFTATTADTTTPSGIDVSSDGTTVRIIDGARIFSYKMSTPWDLTTIYRPQTIRLLEANPRDIYMKAEGDKVYVVGSTQDTVYQYDLSIAWDLEAASLAASFSVASQDTNPSGLTFNSTGTRMYIVGTNKYIYEYSLATPWLVSSATYLQAISLGQILETTVDFIDFSPDGLYLYMGVSSTSIDTYYLSNAFDLLSVRTVNRFYYDQIANITIIGVEFNADGTEAYILNNDYLIYKLYLAVPWDVGTSRYQKDVFNIPNLSATQGALDGLEFSANGQYLYVTATSSDTLLRYEMLVPYQLATLQHPYAVQLPNYPATGTAFDLTLQANDSLAFTVINATDNVYRYPITVYGDTLRFGSNSDTVWYRTDATATTLTSAGIQEMRFKPDGTKIYAIEPTTDAILEFSLTTPWDVSTLVLTNVQNIITPEPTTAGLDISSDGQYIYIVGTNTDTVYQYKLAEPWSTKFIILVASYSVAAQEANPSSIAFSSDGIYMYVMGTTGDDINQYTLSTPWDITTASFTRVQSISSQDTAPFDLVFKPDGSRLYVRGTSSTPQQIDEFSLGTPWDVSTLSYSRSLNLPTFWGLGGGIALNYNGTRLYVGDLTNFTINTYELGS